MGDARNRMLQLLSALQTGRSWSGQELAARLGTSPRTLRRDVDRLRELGYPVETRRGPGGHYRLVAGTAMPPLLLDDDEAVAVAVGLRMAAETDDAAVGALRKLEQVLPTRLRHKMVSVTSATETAQGSVAVDAGLLGLVGAAAQRRERLAFTYRTRDGSSSARRADPYRQVLVRRRWYLLAWDVDRADWRTFRLDRVTDAATTGEIYAPRELPAATAAEYIDARLKAARHRAVITFLAPAERVADLIVDRDATLEPLDAERCRYTAWVDSFEWLAVTTTVLGVGFLVEEPVAFAEYCRTLRDRLDRAVRSRDDLHDVATVQ